LPRFLAIVSIPLPLRLSFLGAAHRHVPPHVLFSGPATRGFDTMRRTLARAIPLPPHSNEECPTDTATAERKRLLAQQRDKVASAVLVRVDTDKLLVKLAVNKAPSSEGLDSPCSCVKETLHDHGHVVEQG
jgi:hypothetical protein